MRRTFAILFLLLGCPSSAPPPEDTTPELPMAELELDGQPLYPARPLDEVPQRVSAAWDFFQEAWASEPPMPAENAGADEFREFVSQRFAPYVDEQAQAAAQFLGAWEEASEPEEQLFYSVLAARLLHRASSWMWELPLPDEDGVNPAARQALEQSLRGAAKDLAGYAHQAFGKCVEAAGTAPGNEHWRVDCTRRAEALEPIRTAQIGPPPPTPMPEGCEDHTDPLFASPQHDPEARPQLLVLVEAESEDVDTAAVQRAVERWARSEHDLRPVPAARRRAAERLVEAGKTSRRGPECAAAPSVTWVLGSQIENLVVAKVLHACEPAEADDADEEDDDGEESPAGCGLSIAWQRAGSVGTEGLPDWMDRRIGPEPDADEVLAALTMEAEPAASVQRTRSVTGARMTLAEAETNPGYRLRAALTSLSECQTERGASQLQLGWTVTPTGAVESVTATGASEAINACVKEKLEQLALTCTPSGDPIAMQTTLCLAR